MRVSSISSPAFALRVRGVELEVGEAQRLVAAVGRPPQERAQAREGSSRANGLVT